MTNDLDKRVKQIQTFVLHHNDVVSVSVVFSDDSEWSGTVSMERYELMKQEEFEHETHIEPSIDNDLIGYMNHYKEFYGLCAWCQSYFVRTSGLPIVKLTAEEFEMTRQSKNSVSHGCCETCKEMQKRELKMYKEMKKLNSKVNANKGNSMKKAILMILVAASLMAMSACSNPTSSMNVKPTIEYPQIKGADIPDTNLPIIEPTI